MCFNTMLFSITAIAQSENSGENIDPRLIEIIRIVKSRTAVTPKAISNTLTRDEVYLNLIDKMHTAFYSQNPEEVTQAVENFELAYSADVFLDLSRVSALHSTYARLLLNGANTEELQNSLDDLIINGNWFEKYVALSMSARLHGTAQERQAALQKSQLALSIIPTNPDLNNKTYIEYAKARITSLIANLHNLQGNSELALITSLDFLQLTEENPNPKLEVDLINNLIYSYSIGRNHEAQLYLSEQLLELEKTRSSTVLGLTEMRIAGVMNSSGRFADGLRYAQQSLNVATNPIVQRASQVNNAAALAGLGRFDESRAAAKLAEVNFAPEHMLKVETRRRDLYLAFLLAQAEDPEYATQLFNRQLDVNAHQFLANNSRDTTAMLAALENSRERQAERDAATAREAELQAITISRQRNLNRALIVLSFLLSLAALAAILFSRFREKVLRKLEIKTREAASAEKLKTEFLGMISHELRTPLNGIIGISDYLANYHEDADIRQKTGIVLKSGNELLSVVESLTDMARIDAGQLALVPHEADLAASLAEVPENWTEKAAAKGLIFTHFIDPAISRYHIDADRIVQCVNILLSNAISFTDSGRVHLHVTKSKIAPYELTVVVADTGQGMSELVQSRLFTPFMQADTSRKRTHMGTGLNLAIAYALTEMMEGSLSCASREGRGSEFTLKIPLPEAVSEAPVHALFKAAGIAPTAAASIPPHPTAALEAPVIERESLNRPILQNPVINKTAFNSIPIEIEAIDEAVTHQTSEYSRRESSERDLAQSTPTHEKSAQPEYLDLMSPSKTHPSLHGPTAQNKGFEYQKEVDGLRPHVRAQRVLVVDDMASNRDVLSLMLESKGYICREAADGYAALAALERQAFDIMILDIHMAPLDGIETLHRIRASEKRYANIPVIALTADNAPRTNAESMDAGADLFLTKPIKRDELLRAISYLRKAESTRILSQQA